MPYNLPSSPFLLLLQKCFLGEKGNAVRRQFFSVNCGTKEAMSPAKTCLPFPVVLKASPTVFQIFFSHPLELTTIYPLPSPSPMSLASLSVSQWGARHQMLQDPLGMKERASGSCCGCPCCAGMTRLLSCSPSLLGFPEIYENLISFQVLPSPTFAKHSSQFRLA